MREFTVPALAEIPASANLSDLIFDLAVRSPHHVQFRRHRGGRWEDVTARDFLSEVTALAKGLIASGIEPGQRVAIMSRTRYEWTLTDFAIWCAGGVPVPIYETSSAEQVGWILSDSDATAVFVETPHHAGIVDEVREQAPGLRHLWTFDDGAIDGLVTLGASIDDAEVETRRRSLTSDSLATLIYTSGTTGRPKGCQLTHGNFMSEVRNIVQGLPELFNQQGSTLLFLPLAHVFARAIEVGCVEAGVLLGHTPDVKNLLADLEIFRPTFILSVPRVFEKIFNSSQAKATAEGKGKIFDRAAAVAVAYSKALDDGGPSIVLRVQHAVFDKLVYVKLRGALGGRVQFAVSGGAPLGARLGHFFRGIGVIILEGYGLTETSAGSNLNRPQALKIGTVGQPIPGTTIRIADDGEILIRGPIIFRGYQNNDAATAESIDADGWFHSGDIGVIDDDGFLTITGRKKEIIVTAGGKNVAPAVLEDRLRAHPLVSQCIVVGDNQPFIACLITLDADALPAWLAANGRALDTPLASLTHDPDLIATIQGAVDGANKAVSNAEAIKKFTILAVDFTEEGGQLTPTLKVKRGVVMADFAPEVSALYS